MPTGALEELINMMTGDDYGLSFDWRFYNDGKAWLGKTVCKKKTILWFSVWESIFMTSFYFMEKARAGIM